MSESPWPGPTADGSVLITGVTGTLGRAVLQRLAKALGGPRVLCLIRPRRGQSAERRLDRLAYEMGLSFAARQRCLALKGDLTEPGLGLSRSDAALVRRSVRWTIHMGAVTTLNGHSTLHDATNVRGTANLLRVVETIGENGPPPRFVHVSSAFAVGSGRPYHSLEDVLPPRPALANPYEASKYAGEKLVRAAMASGLDAVIVRPSVISGHSQTGVIPRFTVHYTLVRALASGWLTKLPCREDAPINLVPIDHVVDGILQTCCHPVAGGRCYHLVARCPTTVGAMLQAWAECGLIRLPDVVAPEQFTPSLLSSTERLTYESLQPFLHYASADLTFDTRNADRLLTVRATDEGWLHCCIEYAIGSGYFSTEMIS